MAVVVSTNLVKVKADNDKEDTRLGQRLTKLERGKAGAIEALHKEKCELLSQLRAQRAQEIRSLVRETLKYEERKRRHDERMLQFQQLHVPRGKGRRVAINGFSKISVDTEDPTEDLIVDSMREKRRKSLYTRSKTLPLDFPPTHITHAQRK